MGRGPEDSQGLRKERFPPYCAGRDFAAMAQVHESYETEDGMMGMREQKEVIVQPGEELRFRQGGLHIMLMNTNRELALGDSVQLGLNFSNAGVVEKKLPVLR